MGKIIYVHGTGVREPSYTNTFKIIEDAINNNLDGWKLVRCYWGEPYGSKLQQDGDSIPSYATARAINEVASEEDEEIALWELLYQDPLFELRTLATLERETKGELAPTEVPPWQQIQDRIEFFSPSQKFIDLLERHSLAKIFNDAIKKSTEAPTFSDAIQQADSDESAFVAIFARALMAQMTILGEEHNLPIVCGSERDKIIMDLVAELGGTSRSISNLIVNPLKGLAMRAVTRRFQRKRRALSDVAAPILGDILLYQTRGSGVRDFIRNQILAQSEPVIVIAHSLGGIACVDLMVTEQLINVKGLITVGSQSPLIYEIDSLNSLRYGEKLPSHFPRWLNVYDPQDFLSYVGEKVFPGRVEDFEVQSRQPFPQSHSAYWTVPDLWKKVDSFVK